MFSNKIIFWETFIIAFLLGWLFINRAFNGLLSADFVINIIFILLLIFVFIFRNSHPRHFYMAFIFLLVTIFGNIFIMDTVVYIFGSMTLNLLFVGVFNMMLFKEMNS